jgi:squalene synthase HpnC
VLPRRVRGDLRAVYAFARGVDELGDSAPGDRTAALHRLDSELDRLWSDGVVTDPVLVRLTATVRAHDLPAQPFHDLVAANLQDQVVSRYESYEELLGYCRLSADPVGRIVLGVLDQPADEAMLRLSDQVCTALQLLEHWQDVAEDRRAGRVYLPQQELRRHGVPESDLDAARTSTRLRGLMVSQTERAAALLEEGAALVPLLDGWARVCVAGFVAGGRATAAALRRSNGDVLGPPVRPSKAATAARLVASLTPRGRR